MRFVIIPTNKDETEWAVCEQLSEGDDHKMRLLAKYKSREACEAFCEGYNYNAQRKMLTTMQHEYQEGAYIEE